MRKVAFIGGRDFTDSKAVAEAFQSELEKGDFVLVSGGARGADSIAEGIANSLGRPTLIFPADWDKHGKAAGFIRNAEVVKASDECVAFWDGKSKGTAHAIELFHKAGKPVKICSYGMLAIIEAEEELPFGVQVGGWIKGVSE